MNVNIGPKNVLEIDGARLVWRNFAGRPDQFNRNGDRNFAVIIPNQEIADKMINHTNKYGVGWNVKIRDPREEGDQPFMFLKVKVKFTDFGPNVYLKSGNNTRMLDESTIDLLDKINIASVDLDIRPYDDMGREGPFRAAYLKSIWVTQDVDRFQSRYAEEEFPGEEPF